MTWFKQCCSLSVSKSERDCVSNSKVIQVCLMWLRRKNSFVEILWLWYTPSHSNKVHSKSSWLTGIHGKEQEEREKADNKGREGRGEERKEGREERGRRGNALYKVRRVIFWSSSTLGFLAYILQWNNATVLSRNISISLLLQHVHFLMTPVMILIELTPRWRTYEHHGQGKKIYKIKTNTSHCPTKTFSKTDTHPLI